MKRSFLGFLFLIISIIPALSQDFFFENFSTSQGLAGSKVYCIEEDNDHFVWLGTEYGVSRFDGSKFITYTTEEGLSEGGVKCILEDRFGQLLFGHYDGNISVYHKGEFSSIDTLHIQGDVREILEDGDKLWIATNGSGIYKIRATAKGWDWNNPEQFMGKEGLSDRVFDIQKLQTGELLFVSEPVVKYYEEESNSFKVYKPGIIPAYFQVTTLLESSNGFLYLGTFNGGVYRINLKTDNLTFFDEKNGLSHNFINSLEEDKEGLIWVGTYGGGVNLIDGNKVIQMRQEQGVLDDFIQCISVSSEGLVLIGNNSTGFQIFKGFQFTNSASFSDEKLRVQGIVELDSKFYGISKGGVFSFELEGGIPLRIKNLERIPFDRPFNYIKRARNGDLWLSSEFQGVFRYDVRSKKLTKIKAIAAYFFITNRVTSFEVDAEGNLWIGTIEGLIYYDTKKDEVELLSQENNLISREISAIYHKNDTVFVGYQESNRGINYILDKRVHRIRIPYVVTPTAFLKKGKELWVGTLNHGVIILENDSIKYRVNSKNGLLNDHVQFLKEDLEGNVWIGNNQGINAIRDFESYWVENYDQEQGVLNEQILRNASYIDDQNRMWIATGNDMIINMIDQIPMNLKPAKPVIESVYVNEEKVPLSNIEDFNYSQNDFLIKVASPNLYAPKKTVFYYKIVGFNDNWLALSGESEINLMNLNPGTYALHLKTIGFDGTEQLLDKPLQWTIKPPWYFSMWFLISALAFLLLINRLYIQLRERNLKREKILLENKVTERTRLIVLKNNQLAQKNKDITDSLQYASRIQSAVLPSTSVLESRGFVYYKPKDIVSGDFYFVSKQKDALYVCAADCTGHGVPGALLSIMGRNIMDRIISSNPNIEPGKFLDMLNKRVAETLQKDAHQAINDGMDLALVKVSFKDKKIYYAGAYNPMYLIRGSELMELKADRFSIGSQKIMPDLHYQTKELAYEENDRVYLFSDGLPDQFGGPEGKKLKTSGLKNFLLSIQDVNIVEQQSKINAFKVNWQGEEDQVDDILMMGFEIADLKGFTND
jgi:ligand-binding sensor domain-containing protein/serine phosphatase RsbU (regulator of sigma subunit)